MKNRDACPKPQPLFAPAPERGDARSIRTRGHELDIINTLRCYMNIASRRPEIYYNGEKLRGYDAVIPRIGASVTFYGMAVLRQFEMMGVYPAQRKRRHRPFARQAALDAAACARRDRPAGDDLRP
jgi:hypothetical protein